MENGKNNRTEEIGLVPPTPESVHRVVMELDISESPIDFQWESRKYPG